MKSHCRYCGKALPLPHAGRGKQKRFCSDNCRVKFAYRQQNPKKATNAERRLRRKEKGIVPPDHMRYSTKMWLAAYWDGEGYIGLARRRKRPGEKFYYFPIVQVYNTNQLLMAYAAGLLNVVSLDDIEYRSNGEGNKKIYRLSIARSGMRSFLLKLRPLLVAKKRQAEIVAEFCRISDRCYVREYPEAVYGQMWQEMAALNKRGVECP